MNDIKPMPATPEELRRHMAVDHGGSHIALAASEHTDLVQKHFIGAHDGDIGTRAGVNPHRHHLDP